LIYNDQKELEKILGEIKIIFKNKNYFEKEMNKYGTR